MTSLGVTVVAGFLGSGKTTLLQRVVRDPEVGGHVAVIVNELGALGLDQELIASERTTPTLQVRQLTSGCVCCTLRGELLPALRELAGISAGLGSTRALQQILIETSGAARASEVSYAVNAVSFEAPFHTDAVVTLVDAHNARRAHAEQQELFEDQVRSADLILLNKADLVQDPAARAELESWVRQMAPRAGLLWTERASLSPALLLGQGLGITPGDRQTLPAAGPAARWGTLAALTVPVPFPIRHDLLEDWLEELADRIFRVKGVVDVAQGPLLVQAVGDRIELDLLAADSPLRGAARRLIFIGTQLGDAQRTALQAALERLRDA